MLPRDLSSWISHHIQSFQKKKKKLSLTKLSGVDLPVKIWCQVRILLDANNFCAASPYRASGYQVKSD